jgi:hypothetical protein
MSNGEIELLDPDGRTADTGPDSMPIDLIVSSMGHYLYALLSGTHEIAAFEVAPDGSLSPLEAVGGLPPGANGLAGF